MAATKSSNSGARLTRQNGGTAPISSKAAGKRAQKDRSQEDVEASIPMGKMLASTEKRTRDSAIRSLAAFLAKSGDEPLPPLEMAKLWKGIFYCFWMSDKPLVQQGLATELSNLLLAIPGTSRVEASAVTGFTDSTGQISARARGGLALLEGFWDAMTREWAGLDKWRTNKFYMLLRRFLNAAFRLLATEGWDGAAVAHLGRLLTKAGGPLCANDVKVPDSLTYHMTDIYLEEMEKALVWAETEEDVEDWRSGGDKALMGLLQPMLDTAATCHSKTVFEKVIENVVQPLVDDCLAKANAEQNRLAKPAAKKRRKTRRGGKFQASESEDEDDDEDEDEEVSNYPHILALSSVSPLALRKRIYQRIFKAASKEEANPARRRRLYQMFQEEKQRREEMDEESDDDDDEDDDDE